MRKEEGGSFLGGIEMALRGEGEGEIFLEDWSSRWE